MWKNVYESTPDRYLMLLNSPIKKYCFKLELLTHHEETIGEIVREISKDNSGQITVNKSQGVRRACSLTLIDVEQEYQPTPNSSFWYNRKFKLYIGLQDIDEHTIYWFCHGVFVTQNASAVHNMTTINAVDKFGFFDGSLNTQMSGLGDILNAGLKVGRFIRDAIRLDLGNGLVTDPIAPMIDLEFEQAKVLNDIVLNAGQYVGELLIQIADSYGCDVYYDRLGRLQFTRGFADDLAWSYGVKGATWQFDNVGVNYIDPSVNWAYDGVNTITVSTNNTEGVIYTYTAINDNPESKVAISDIGRRYNAQNPVTYIPLADGASDDTCRQYAEFLLLQNTFMTINASFNSPIIPHIDVNDAVIINDDYFKWAHEKFIIQSLTIPLKNDLESFSVTNVRWLPHSYKFKKDETQE